MNDEQAISEWRKVQLEQTAVLLDGTGILQTSRGVDGKQLSNTIPDRVTALIQRDALSQLQLAQALQFIEDTKGTPWTTHDAVRSQNLAASASALLLQLRQGTILASTIDKLGKIAHGAGSDDPAKIAHTGLVELGVE